MDNIKNKKSTGERLEFYEFSNVTVEHLHRYTIALDFVKEKRVLDIASGEGYGSFLLSNYANYVYGVDIDEDSINESRIKYKRNNLAFKVGSASNIPLEDNSVDVVVSFETIEHHDQHNQMLIEIKRVLKDDGVLIISSPDKKYYSDLIGQNNPFHVKELYLEEFKMLMNTFFKYSTFYFQKAYNFNSYVANEFEYNKIKLYEGDNELLRSMEIEPLYNIAIVSNNKYEKIENSFFNGEKIREKQIQNIKVAERLKVKETLTFKIGKAIWYPIFYLKSKIKKSLKSKSLF